MKKIISLKMFKILLFSAFVTITISCAGEPNPEELAALKSDIAAYALVNIQVDLSNLDVNQTKVYHKLVEASKAIDMAFWKQHEKEALIIKNYLADATSEKDILLKNFVDLNYGPFDVRKDNQRFYVTGMTKLPGAGFYPEDITKEEFMNYTASHPEQKISLESLYTIVKRDGSNLVAVPFNIEFRAEVTAASNALKEAAEFADNPSLKKYLTLRAAALLNDEYYESDMAWMDMKDNLLDIVVGPIETYEDGLMGLKASYEGSVMIKDVEASASLDLYKSHLDVLERNLPVDPKYRRLSAGTGNVLEIVNIGNFSGDFNKAIKTIAASLPNDGQVIAQKGGKKQMYKNIMEAKFEKNLVPLSKNLVAQDLHGDINRESFITNVLMHEVSHTLGPVEVYGSNGITLRSALQENYSPLEECKADVIGIHSNEYFLEQGSNYRRRKTPEPCYLSCKYF